MNEMKLSKSIMARKNITIMNIFKQQQQQQKIDIENKTSCRMMMMMIELSAKIINNDDAKIPKRKEKKHPLLLFK